LFPVDISKLPAIQAPRFFDHFAAINLGCCCSER
jgi:hypothetical protein